MGGDGSGRWHNHTARPVKEQSLTITPKLLRSGGGVVNWTQNGEPCGSIRYTRTTSQIILRYTWSKEPVTEAIRIESGHLGFMEGEWFLCPLSKSDGTSCNRPCRKLYLPAGRRYFACSKCHNLTYRSSNLSHSLDRGHPARFARSVGIHPKLFEAMFR